MIFWVGGAESELPVQRKVPEHREHQRREIAQPVREVQQLVEQGERSDLDEPGADGKEREFDDAP